MKKLVLHISLLLCGLSTVAQTLNQPIPADNPNLPGNSPWTAACASDNFNEYFINFTWAPPLVGSDNTFILQLSDANGDFSNPTTLASVDNKNTDFDFDFQFTLPKDTQGENYKFRVKSTSPEKYSPASQAYSMYYVDYTANLLISPNGDGNIPQQGQLQFCDGNTLTLKPHNIANADAYQYNWYRSGTLLAEKGPALSVDKSGIYMVEVDYGSVCSNSANTLSNAIEVISGSSLGIAINIPSKTTLCTADMVSLETNITDQGLTYTWYKDDAIIAGPAVDLSTLDVSGSTPGFEGSYAVEVYGPGACLERSDVLQLTNAGNFTVSVVGQTEQLLLPEQMVNLTISTSAENPSIQWYFNGTAINGATEANFEASQIGAYTAQVSQPDGDCPSAVVVSETFTVFRADDYTLSIAFDQDYTACQTTNTTLQVSKIEAIVNNAPVDVTATILPTLDFQWQKDGIDISSATAASISLDGVDANGTYKVIASNSDFNGTSNSLDVSLRPNENIIIVADGQVTCESGDTITLSTDTDLTNTQFTWYKNGNPLNDNTSTLITSDPGIYSLEIVRGSCSIRSNELNIGTLDPNLVQLDVDGDIVIPEGGSQSITATGADSYTWYDANNTVIGSAAFITLSAEGTYFLAAQIGACEVTKQVSLTFQDSFKVPNVITVNGDGVNDLWVLPNSYSRKQDVAVTIFNTAGQQIFSETNYQNNWPASAEAFPDQNMVFFYKIEKNQTVLKQGTITIIR